MFAVDTLPKPETAASAAPRVEVEAGTFAALGLIKVAERAIRRHGQAVTLAMPNGRDLTVLAKAAHAAFWHDNPDIFFKDTGSPSSGVSMTRDILGRTLLTAADGSEWAQMRAQMTGLLAEAKPWFQRPLAAASAEFAAHLTGQPDVPLLDHCVTWATRAICDPLIGARALDAAAHKLVMQLNAGFLSRIEGEAPEHGLAEATSATLARIGAECSAESVSGLLQRHGGLSVPERAEQDELRSVIGGMLAGSLHINALCLFWLLTLVAAEPDLQQRLHAEAQTFRLRQRRAIDTPLAFACVREAQRLRPVMAFIERQLRADAVVDAVLLKAGQTVLFSPWFAQRDAALWPEPLSFAPDRFLSAKRLAPGSYFPFGTGPRMCPGANAVNQQLTYTLSALTLDHGLALAQDTRPGDLGTLFRINLEPRGPARLAVWRRSEHTHHIAT